MKRILLVGSGGAGKSTVAAQIAEKLGLPCVHLDKEFWQPGWVQPDKAAFRRKLLRLLKRPGWVMDGHFGGTQELRFKYADTVLFFDFNRWICTWRILKRVMRYRGRIRPDMAEGCPEQFDWDFLVWIWRFPDHSRKATLARLTKLEKRHKLVVLRNPRDVRAFLASI